MGWTSIGPGETGGKRREIELALGQREQLAFLELDMFAHGLAPARQRRQVAGANDGHERVQSAVLPPCRRCGRFGAGGGQGRQQHLFLCGEVRLELLRPTLQHLFAQRGGLAAPALRLAGPARQHQCFVMLARERNEFGRALHARVPLNRCTIDASILGGGTGTGNSDPPSAMLPQGRARDDFAAGGAARVARIGITEPRLGGGATMSCRVAESSSWK